MKLLGIQRVDGGVAIGLPSGRHILMALPNDPKRAAYLLGERLFRLLDDPEEPEAQRAPPVRRERSPSEPYEDLVSVVNTGIDASRTLGEFWRAMKGGRGGG